jgi:hypothetical protein
MLHEGGDGCISLGSDFILHIKHQSLDKPRLIVEYDPVSKTSAAVVSFCPPVTAIQHQMKNQINAEIVFIIDRSGSMGGTTTTTTTHTHTHTHTHTNKYIER